MKLLDQRRESV
jgi:hypothetical protein